MQHIFGFTLQLIRKDDNDALCRTAAVGAGKVVLSKLAWVVPIIQPNDVLKVNLYKSIAANITIPVGFRRRQCETFTQEPPSGDWVLALHRKIHDGYWLDCKQARVVTRNAAIFDHCNLTNMFESSQMQEQYAGIYKSFYDLASRYYGIDSLLAGSQVNPAAYKALYPIHVFDVSKQSERLRWL